MKIMWRLAGILAGISVLLLVRGQSCPPEDEVVTIEDTAEIGTLVYAFNKSGVSIIDGTCQQYLSINDTQLVLNRSLRENCQSGLGNTLPCNLRVPSTEDPDQTYEYCILLSVSRINKYPPEFKQSEYNVTVLENIANGTEVKSFKDEAFDEDCIEAAITYLVKTGGDGKFAIPAGSTGRLITNDTLAYDDASNYTLTITARISGDLTDTTLVIYVEDVDNKPPTFSQSIFQLNVTEQSIAPSPLETEPAILCYDLDKGLNTAVEYAFEDLTNTSQYFDIITTTGKLQQTRAFDRETTATWEIELKCYQVDDEQKQASALLRVVVVDINDEPVVFNRTQYTVSVNENHEGYITTVTATDKDQGDNSIFTYDIIEGEDAFNIDGDGTITVKNKELLDRERAANMSILIRAKDSDGNFSINNATVTVTLVDLNDNTPTFEEAKYTFLFNKTDTGDIIGSVKAVDLDQPNTPFSDVTYALGYYWTSPEVWAFPLGVITNGSIEVTGVINPQTEYNMLVNACDNDNPRSDNSRCSSVQVVAVLTSNITYITHKMSMSVPEGVPIGSIVGMLPVADDYNVSLHQFQVDTTRQHMLITAAEMDREINATYDLVVEFSAYTTGVSGLLHVNITVLDVNDNTPTFAGEYAVFGLPLLRNSHVDWAIQCTDKDEGNNSNVTYSLYQRAYPDVVELDPSSGVMTLDDKWWDTQEPFYQLMVKAQDNGSPPLEATQLVYVTLTNISEDQSAVRVPSLYSLSTINENREQLEGNISAILDVDVKLSAELISGTDLNPKKFRTFIFITATGYNSTDQLHKLLRLVLEHWTSFQDVLQSRLSVIPEPLGQTTTDDGLQTAEIALIAVAGAIFCGGLISIIVLCKQWDRHTKRNQLYDHLRRPSTIYDSQEIRVDFSEETPWSTCNSFRSTPRRKNADDTFGGSFGLHYVNPAYAKDETDEGPKTPTWNTSDITPRIPRWSTSDSLKDAMESLDELTNRLNSEDNLSRITNLSRDRKSLKSQRSDRCNVEVRNTDRITPVPDYPLDVDVKENVQTRVLENGHVSMKDGDQMKVVEAIVVSNSNGQIQTDGNVLVEESTAF